MRGQEEDWSGATEGFTLITFTHTMDHNKCIMEMMMIRYGCFFCCQY